MTHTTHQCPSPWQCQKKTPKQNLWDLFSEADLFTFSLFLLLLILSGIPFPLTPLFWWELYLIGGSKKTSWLIRQGGIDRADPLPWPSTFWLTAVPIMRPQNRDGRIGGFWGRASVGKKKKPKGISSVHAHSPAQSSWCHCYIALPSITPICIIGFCIVWPRHIKVRHRIVDCKSARAHCLLISVH